MILSLLFVVKSVKSNYSLKPSALLNKKENSTNQANNTTHNDDNKQTRLIIMLPYDKEKIAINFMNILLLPLLWQ